MPSPLELTYSTLQKSRNDAANGVLAAALASDQGPPSSLAVGAALQRRGKAAHTRILERWHELDSADKQKVAKARGQMSSALRDAVLSPDSQTFTNACEVIALTDEFDLVPTLVNVAEHLDNPHSKAATGLVVMLSERMGALLVRAESESLPRDPRNIRKNLVDCLRRSLERYRYHKLDGVVEAFLLLCDASDGSLQEMLDDPHHPCFQTLSQVLARSSHQKIIKLVLDLLASDKPPSTLFSVISHREDLSFIRQFFEFCASSDNPAVARNLKQLRALGWLNRSKRHLSQFDEKLQQKAVLTLSATNVPQVRFLEALEELLANGETAGRAAACHALEKISGERTNKLIMRATSDPSAEVKAAALRQLRMRHIPGTMPLLERMLDSPVELLQQAAREALAEFTFEGYLKDYDLLHEEIRITTGRLVQKVDLDYLQKLKSEFGSQVVKRRLRAIEITQLLKVVPSVEEELLDLSGDNEHFVRAAVAEALRFCPTPEVLEILELMTQDRSGSVQNAAKESLAAINSELPAHEVALEVKSQ